MKHTQWLVLALVTLAAVSLSLWLFAPASPSRSLVVEALEARRQISLNELSGQGNHCVFPLGTVVPWGEAAHIYETRNIAFSSHYNSHDYWFVVIDNHGEVLIHPIGRETGYPLNDEIVCGQEVLIDWVGDTIKVVNREGS